MPLCLSDEGYNYFQTSLIRSAAYELMNSTLPLGLFGPAQQTQAGLISVRPSARFGSLTNLPPA
eukprot:scaffold1014_cov142-Skeletonema_dohrnii-CCMP3373.AAC.3